MGTFKAKNGFTLADNMTGWGWEIRSATDLITALEGLPEFETVATAFIVEALESAVKDGRTQHKNLQDLADTLTKFYI